MTTPHEPVDLTRTAPGGTTPTVAPAERKPSRRGAPLPVAAVVAALWAAVVGYVPVVALTMLASLGQPVASASVLRIGTVAWLLGNGVAVETPTDRVTVVPLAVAAFVGWRLVRAGLHANRATGGHRARSVWPAVRAGTAVAIVYALLGVVAARLASTADLGAPVARTAVTFAMFAAVAATGGALAHGRAGLAIALRLPAVLVDGLRTGLATLAFLLAAGAGAAGLSLALAGGAATEVLASFGAGISGQAGITGICLVYLPNVAVWATAYLLGPGFVVGDATVVSPGDVLLGPVPALPVLAGLPSAPLTGVGPALLGVPLLAGLAAGWLLARRHRGGWGALLGAAALAGPVAGGLLQLAGYAASGGLGSGRLATLGVVDARVGLFAAGVSCAGTLIGAAATRTLSRAAASPT